MIPVLHKSYSLGLNDLFSQEKLYFSGIKSSIWKDFKNEEGCISLLGSIRKGVSQNRSGSRLKINSLFNLSPVWINPGKNCSVLCLVAQSCPILYWRPILSRQDSKLRQLENLGNHNYLNAVTTLILHLRKVKVLFWEVKTPEPWAALSYWPVQWRGQDPPNPPSEVSWFNKPERFVTGLWYPFYC